MTVIEQLINFETIRSSDHDLVSGLKIRPYQNVFGESYYISEHPILVNMIFEYRSEVIPGCVTHIIKRVK